MVAGDDRERADDQRDPRQVPPHADRVEQADQADAEQVQHRVQQQDGAEDQHGLPGRRREAPLQVRERAGEQGGAVVDAGDGAEQPEQVQPAGVPAPAPAAEPVGHVVQRAGGRIGAGDLGEGEADAQHEQADARPAPQHHGGTAGVQAEPVQRHAAGQDRDHREADREVAEAAHPAGQHRPVAEFAQPLLLVLLGQAGRRRLFGGGGHTGDLRVDGVAGVGRCGQGRAVRQRSRAWVKTSAARSRSGVRYIQGGGVK